MTTPGPKLQLTDRRVGERSRRRTSSRFCAAPAPSDRSPVSTPTPRPRVPTNAGPVGTELFRSSEKFESHCGWPSFFDPADSDAVILRADDSMGAHRVEVLCANCHSHLGHVFEGEGYPTPTDQRYCINSISLRLVPAE